MMNNNIKILSNDLILKGIANFIKQTRLEQNKSQQDLAELAGIDRTTLGQFENGARSISITTLIQLLRALNRLDVLSLFESQPVISPLKLAQLEERKRKRASKSPQTDDSQPKSDW
jgi:transcriptional regulator with XRE-family HTH domain